MNLSILQYSLLKYVLNNSLMIECIKAISGSRHQREYICPHFCICESEHQAPVNQK